jgi:LmbE family N-acetylglucosaminyl deacetylase
MKEKILVIAAHPDDEVLGCGGTIAKKALFEKSTIEVLILSKGVKSRSNILKNINKEIKNNIQSAFKSN